MKRIMAVLALASIGFGSCEKIDKLTQFTVTDRTELKIEAGAATLLPYDVYTPPIYSEASRELTMNNSKADMLESVTLQEFRMVISVPVGRSWDFLKDIEVFIDADQLPEKRIAFEKDITDHINGVLLLKSDNVQLADYLKKGTYIIKTRLTTDKIITEDLNVSITTKYAVDAKVLGL
ncbi:hypothetical protein [Flavihumibacter sp. CACIAM 22H1]|uniref:hypothetical protein n=1 Tax=Flavihumibacter sp. CACIAM 22H1 TaxID=1812911 RepID=UPI0007A867CB|nr:hypothetical protein [Flavihumibacter sp. CACIAM 22H1]KYP15636.1 MAG: hypothetical protein A1D16_10740 [Flavihumibacter sp. CACIAM 22H1]